MDWRKIAKNLVYERIARKIASENPLENAGVAEEKNVTVKDVDKDQYEKGVKIEMEHTKSPEAAGEISLDHLAEVKGSRYYTWLEFVEKMVEKTANMVADKLEEKIKKLEEYWNTL